MSTNKHILIVGVGSIGERHLRCFLATQRVEAIFCEPNDALRQTIADRYAAAKPFRSLDDAMAAGRIDMAVICTPAQLHIPMAIQLAKAGIHLLIEKPLSTSLDRIDELKRIIADRKLVAGIGYTWRSHPAFAEARRMIQEGTFGKPVQLISTGGQHFPTFRPAYRDIYYRDHRTGGGAIQDSLTHNINAGEGLVGPITRIAVDAEHKVLEGVNVEDTVNIIARHGDVMAGYLHNQHQAPNEWTLTVVCEKGTVRMEAHTCSVRWITQPNGEWQVKTFGPLERDTLYISQADAMLDALEQKGPVRCTVDEGLQTLKVNLAALESARSGAWVTIA